MGRKGGQASGPARMVKMTAEQRSEVARTAAKKGAEVRSKKAAANKAGNKSKRRTESSSVNNRCSKREPRLISRLVRRDTQRVLFSGEGGLFAPARWHHMGSDPPGFRLRVGDYAAASPKTAPTRSTSMPSRPQKTPTVEKTARSFTDNLAVNKQWIGGL